MISLFEDKHIINELADKIKEVNILNIFDFDGTIFNSPVPNIKLWGGKMWGKLMAETTRGGYGWFQHTISLDNKYIKDCTFNDNVVDKIQESMKNPTSATILLTGRNILFEPIIKNILTQKGLLFDDYGFKPLPQEKNITTFNFKKNFILELLDKYNVNTISLYDDRKKQILMFDDFFKMSNIDATIHFINKPECYLNSSLEKELVNRLIELSDSNKSVVESAKSPYVLYWGVKLSKESHNELFNQFKNMIDNNWKIYANHMTMLFGKNKNNMVENYIKNNLNKSVSIQAIAIGKSDKALAVQIKSDIPTDNKVAHITIAVSPNGKPYDSNNIINWILLKKPINLFGVISAFTK